MPPPDLPLSRLTLRFHAPEREAAYRQAQFTDSLWLLRWALALSVLVQLAYLHLDTLVLGDQAPEMWVFRLAVGIPVSVIAFLLSFHPRFESMDQPVAAAVVLVNGLTTVPANLLIGPESTMYFVPGTVVVAMYGYVLVGLRFAWAAPLVGAIVALDLATLWALDTPEDLMAKALYMLVISCGILTVGAYRMEMTSRLAHYTAERLLARERHERQAEAARIDWLENLAHFLRHELRNSVVGVKTSLDLLERRTSPDTPTLVYFERARAGIKVIGRLLESASEASSLESSFIRDPLETLDLAPLVRAEVEGHRVMHPDVDFDLRPNHAPLWVQGNPERLVQLIQNLLANAVDHHCPGTAVRVSLARVSPTGSVPWARLAVQNQGPPLPPEGDAIFDLFASFRAQTDPASRRGFGLYLVRLIAERYGGSASAEDLPAGDGVRFEVLLPLVTPCRSG
jgi:signal transduction histidine kinase